MSNAYPVEKIQEGLFELVANNGSLKKAAAKTGISENTLRNWRDEQYTEKYRDILETWERRVEDEIVQLARDNALKAAQATSEAIDKSLEALRNDFTKPAEKAQIALNLSKVMGTNVDKVLAMTGRAVDGGNSGLAGAELVRALLQSGVVKVTNQESKAIEASAQEMTP